MFLVMRQGASFLVVNDQLKAAAAKQLQAAEAQAPAEIDAAMGDSPANQNGPAAESTENDPSPADKPGRGDISAGDSAESGTAAVRRKEQQAQPTISAALQRRDLRSLATFCRCCWEAYLCWLGHSSYALSTDHMHQFAC